MLNSSWLWSLLTYLVFDNLQFWGVLVWYFVEYLPIGICPVFLWIFDWVMDCQRKIIKCHFIISYQSYSVSSWFIICNANLDHLVEIVFIEFLYCKYTLLHPFCTARFRSHYTQPTVKELRAILHFLEAGVYSQNIWIYLLSS